MTKNEREGVSIPPKRNGKDIVHELAKSAISSIPVAGGPAAEWFAYFFIPPIEKRRDEWLQSLAECIQELTKRVESIEYETLSNNNSFITTTIQATYIAIRNHDEDKLAALRNAVLNSALDNSPDDDLQMMFLSYVDYMTSWHLKILDFIDNPKHFFQNHGVEPPEISMGSISHLLEIALPDLKGKQEFYSQVVNDLHSRGLSSMDAHTLSTTMTASDSGIYASRISDIGKKFLDFIKEPQALKE